MRRALRWAFNGALSGAAADAIVFWSEKSLTSAWQDAVFHVTPGLAFGSVVAVTLYRRRLASRWRCACFAAASVAAWPAAYYSALLTLSEIGVGPAEFAAAGLAGGLVWAAVLTSALPVLPFARHPRLWIMLLAGGGAAGVACIAPLDYLGALGGAAAIYLVLWSVWCAVYAAILSTALPAGESGDTA